MGKGRLNDFLFARTYLFCCGYFLFHPRLFAKRVLIAPINDPGGERGTARRGSWYSCFFRFLCSVNFGGSFCAHIARVGVWQVVVRRNAIRYRVGRLVECCFDVRRFYRYRVVYHGEFVIYQYRPCGGDHACGRDYRVGR